MNLASATCNLLEIVSQGVSHMKTHARVVVIGGGVVGCSVLYHLTKLGWSDVMLIERSDLTSGSTWHAAGGFHTLNGDTNMAALQGYTIRLYKELEAITGMSCGLHHVGGVTLADNPARLEMLKAERAKHRYMGLDTEILSPAEITRLTDGLVNVDMCSIRCSCSAFCHRHHHHHRPRRRRIRCRAALQPRHCHCRCRCRRGRAQPAR